MKEKTALIMVDLQNDFCRGGSLEVPDADAVVPLANQLQAYFDVLVATQDWHPVDHMSFAANHPGQKIGDVILVHGIQQVLWPVHCVQNKKGSQFHPKFDVSCVHKIVLKGTDKTIDSYSAFFDNEHKRATGLAEYLREQGVKKLYILGLATDYCVKYSCRDAVKLGFDVSIIEDACRGVELKPGDIAAAYQEMRDEGVKVVKSADIFTFVTT